MAIASFYNLTRVTTSTVGTGTVTLGSAVAGFLTFAEAGVPDGALVSYGIKDGASSEVGQGVYSSSGPTMTRVVRNSTNSDAALSLSGSAQVFLTVNSDDFDALVTATHMFNLANFH